MTVQELYERIGGNYAAAKRILMNDTLIARFVAKLPEDKSFIEGLEILFKVPPEVVQWMDSVSWAFYNGVKPEPTENRTDYRGKRTTVGTFGDLLSLSIKVPLSKENSIKQDAYSVYIDDIPDFKNGKVFVRLQLASRTAPATLDVSVVLTF